MLIKAPGLDAAVHPDVLAPGQRIAGDHAGGRQEPPGRVLGADPGLHSPSPELDLLLGEGQRFAGGDPQLKFHQIQTGNHFRDRMFHLEAGVHFQKIKAACSGPR